MPTRAYYSEKLEVGYRWYDAHKVVPAFAFGHGLSYTTFHYDALEAKYMSASRNLNVSCMVTNNGTTAGAEVAQLYLRYPDSAGQPFKQLRGFHKVLLQPRERKLIRFTVDTRWLSSWDASTHSWKLAVGNFEVLVGSSSADIRLQGRVSTAD